MVAKTRGAKLQKGQRLQKWVCEKISDLLDIPYGVDEQIASRESGQPGTDIRLVGVAKKLFLFSIECKNQETWSIPAWVKQAKANQADGTDWLLFVKKNHVSPIIIMDAESFFKLLKENKI